MKKIIVPVDGIYFLFEHTILQKNKLKHYFENPIFTRSQKLIESLCNIIIWLQRRKWTCACSAILSCKLEIIQITDILHIKYEQIRLIIFAQVQAERWIVNDIKECSRICFW